MLKKQFTTRSVNEFAISGDYEKEPTLFKEEQAEELECMTEDEYRVNKAEAIIPDDYLEELLDTTMRIEVEKRLYKITPYGTFSVGRDSANLIDDAIASFDTTLISSHQNGEYINLPNGVVFTNSFGEKSEINDWVVEDSNVCLDTVAITRAVGDEDIPRFHEIYNCTSNHWKNHSVWQKFWDKIRGKDVNRENNFDSKHRVQVTVFNINYAFYASAGIKVAMQRRKKFLFAKYWVNTDAEKLAIGFNYVYGVMKLKNPASYSSISPTTSTQWGRFKGAINGIISDYVYGIYHKLPVVKDWVDDIYMFLPEVTISNNTYPNRDMMNTLYNLPPKYVYRFLKDQAGKTVYGPISKRIRPTDPRIAYYVWGENNINYNSEKPYIIGVKEYGRGSHKTVRFDQSCGFNLNNFAVTGFLPSEFKIKEIDAFGAAYYNNRWKGVRFYK
jgi:hypothetical protein